MPASQSEYSREAWRITEMYNRLKRMGIQTPSIDLAAVENDFHSHIEYLTFISAYLSKSDLRDIKREAKRFLAQADLDS
jgi:hypothetical protein